MKWLKRKSRNRRLQREHLLDVRLNSQQLRAARLRFAGIGLSIVFGIVFVVFGFWRGGEWLLDRFIYSNNSFAIQLVDVDTDGVVAEEYLRHWTMVKQNQNLLALDLGKVKRYLELIPIVQSASVERILPNTLRVRISERVPIAQIHVMQLRAGGGYEQVVYHFDESGFVFRPLDARFRTRPADTNEHLPIISGVDTRELKIGKAVESEQIRGALQLISEFDRSSMFGLVDVLRIDVSTPEILHVYTEQGSEIYFSLTEMERQFRRWRIVYDQSQRWGKAIGSLDLSVSNNVPLRLVEATPTSTARSKYPKPTRTKKKNV